MKVLLVQSYLGRKESDGFVFPLGLSYIATALAKREHEVRLLDMNLYDNPYAELRELIREFKPRITGISLRNIDTVDKNDIFYYYDTLDSIIQTIKKEDPSMLLMIGGAGFSIFAPKIMERHVDLDFGVFLEGDESAPDLLDNIDSPELVEGIFYRKNGVVSFTGLRPFPDFTKISMPSRGFAEINKYASPRSIGVQSKRGCVLDCAYCSYPSLNGSKIRVRKAKDVVDEIEYLNKTLDVREVIFTDNMFNIPQSHAVDICNEILRRQLKIKWSAWFDLKNFTDEFADLAIQAGCYRMCFSPDGSSNLTLKALGKNFSEKDIQNVISIGQKHPEVDFRFSIFCTPPDQNLEGIIKTILLIIKTHVLMNNGKCFVSWIRILPNTQLYSTALKEGVITNETDLLPVNKKNIHELFYSNRKIEPFATPFFMVIIKISSILRDVIKLLYKFIKIPKRILKQGLS